MADVFSLDKLSIKKLKALAGRNNVSLRGCFEKSDIIKTLRDAGVKEHSGPPPATSSSNEATPRHAQQYNATVPGQAYTSAYSSPMPSARKPRSKEADLQALSISQLKRVARERRIDTSHCFEKADLIAAAQELFEPVPEGAEAGSAARKWVDAQEIRDEQEREKKTLDDIGTGGAPIIRSAPHEGSKL